jgi:hypothetical protein
MTTNSHTPIPFGAPATSAVLEAPLGQLDAAIATVIATGSGTSTTLTAQANAGQASLTVASSAGFAPGDPIYIGTGATFESRIINTVPGGGVTITVTVNLTNTYAIGKPVSKSPVELVDARSGSTTLKGRLDLINRLVFNVRTYGAVGNGSTDDTTAIAAAITAAGVGGHVDFPVGTYLVSASLVPLSGQSFTGAGLASKIIRANSHNNPVFNMGTGGMTDLLFADLLIDGNRAGTTTSAQSMIQGFQISRSTFRGLTIQNAPANCPGIYINGGDDNVVDGCTFQTLGDGVIFGATANAAYTMDRNRVVGCTFKNIDVNGIYFTGSILLGASTVFPKDAVIVGNSLTGCGDTAIEAGTGCIGAIVVGNTVNGGTGAYVGMQGIFVRDNSASIVSGNAVNGIAGTPGDGISVQNLLTSNTDIAIGPNVVRSCVGSGLYVRGGNRLSVVGGTYARNGARGVWVREFADFQLSGVMAAENVNEGFLLGGAAEAVLRGAITGCTAIDNGYGTANSADGFALLNASSTDIFLSSLVAYDTRAGASRTQRYGIALVAGTNVSLGGPLRLVNNATAPLLDSVASRQLIVAAAVAASGPANTIVKKIQVFDATGTSLGWIPIYTSVT